MVCSKCACPMSNWIVRRSVPASNRVVAKLWRIVCAPTVFLMPARLAASLQTYHNRGIALTGLGRYEEARASYERALELNPECAESHLNHSLLLLLHGDLERGWAEYRAPAAFHALFLIAAAVLVNELPVRASAQGGDVRIDVEA